MFGTEKVNPVVVRVKRRIDEISPSSICLVDDTSKGQKKSLLSSLNNLSTNDSNITNPNPNHVYLHRVDTVSVLVESRSSDNVDDLTLASLRKRIRITPSSSNVSVNPVWVTSGTKIIKSGDFEDIVVVDMNQLSADIKSNDETKPKSTKIIDPITRRLDAAIIKAYDTGNLSDVVSLVEQGADVNFPSHERGLTALMVAAHHANSRVLSRFLAKGANAYAVDTNGKGALDYVKDVLAVSNMSKMSDPALSHKLGSAMECSLLLHNTLTLNDVASKEKEGAGKTFRRARRTDGAPAEKSNKVPSAASNNEDESKYVYDVYCANSMVDIDNVSMDGVGAQNVGDDAASHEVHDAMIIQIPGMRIDGSGKVVSFLDEQQQQQFVYDSDWSDLADDEDPESNDERYEGNDYPEELDYEGSEDGLDEFNDEPQFVKHRVGRVVRSQVAGGDPESGGVYSESGGVRKSTKALQKLWGMQDRGSDDDEDFEMGGNEHAERLAAMRNRTGMEFGSNTREFDFRTGLPRNGVELSDDEEDDDMVYGALEGLRNARRQYDQSHLDEVRIHCFSHGGVGMEKYGIPLDTVAYDSDMDRDDGIDYDDDCIGTTEIRAELYW